MCKTFLAEFKWQIKDSNNAGSNLNEMPKIQISLTVNSCGLAWPISCRSCGNEPGFCRICCRINWNCGNELKNDKSEKRKEWKNHRIALERLGKVC